MREIRFRAWHKELNRWVYFTLEDALYGWVFNNDRTEKWKITDASVLEHESRFTGLKDKNGVEIYDGDIIKYAYRDYTVVVKPLERGRYSAFWDFSDFLDPSDNELGAEVIGNIYENPELLEAKP